ncbi:MAG: STAS domain-containing protein [Alphaproteobacteria bacterium]|nr:STAS domain-containing protein [Alphaproteobacteria bacterium]MBF0128681.1 STAS domain-containing protein [Alphaproteobacteria bacterium]
MNHEIRTVGDEKEVLLSGRLTFADHVGFRSLIALLDEPGLRRLVFDLNGVEFVDSAALGMLLLARDSAAGRGVRVVLRGARDQVKRIMEVAQFDTLFTIEP